VFVHLKNANRKVRSRVLLVFAITLVVYLSLPTRIYYGDGIGFADDIESAHADPSLLFHANHLIYDSVGYAAWTAVQAVYPNVRALSVLQVMDSFFGAASAALLCYILYELFKSPYIAVWLSFGFAFSATWWRFSTDADSYTASTFFLIASLLFLLPSKKSKPAVLALAHTSAMLLHQLALLFYPACVIGLWYQTRHDPLKKRLATVAQYTVLASFMTMAAYVFAFHFTHGNLDPEKMLSWASSHSYNSAFSFEIGRNLFTSAAGNAKLFMGGRMRFIQETWGYFIASAAVAAIGFFVMMIWRLKQTGVPPLKWPKVQFTPIIRICVVWITVYVVFLVFWLPQNTFYRLFYLPALILLAGTFEASLKTRSHSILALAIGFLFCVNLSSSIYPAAQPALNRTEQFARSMQSVWEPGTTVYGNVYADENLTIKYFNPQVVWKKLWNRAPLEDLGPTLHQARASGKAMWFDLAALEKLSSEDPSFSDWLKANCRLGEKYQFMNANDLVGFVQLVPLIPENSIEHRNAN
jgi:hypothetical protein